MPGPTTQSTIGVGSRPTKRTLSRPPMLSLGLNSNFKKSSGGTSIESAVSPTDILNQYHYADDKSSPTTGSSTSSSPTGFSHTVDTDSDATSDDLSKDLAQLEKLRRNVHNNLRLRPLRSANADDTQSTSGRHIPPLKLQSTVEGCHGSPISSAFDSSAPSPALTIYYTPTSELPSSPLSARFIGHSMTSPPGPFAADATSSASPPPPSIARVSSPESRSPGGLDPGTLFKRLSASTRPLVIDTRQTASYLSFRIKHSLNIAIPSLIMRRCRKPGAGFASLDTLRTYITTEGGKNTWDELMGPGGAWDGDVVIFDDEMDERQRDNTQVLAWAMLSLVQPLLQNGIAEYLKGGMSFARKHPLSHKYITSGEQQNQHLHPHRDLQQSLSASDTREERPQHTPSPRKGGLFQLDTHTASRSKAMPEIEPPSTSPKPASQLPSSSPRNMLVDLSPSPSPSCSVFPGNVQQPRRPSVPNLRKLDTSSAERLVPKLTVRTMPIKSNTLAAPSLSRQSSNSSLRPNSPSHLTLIHSNNFPGSVRLGVSSANSSSECLSPCVPNFRAPSPRTPITPIGMHPSSPGTARPELDQPPTTEDLLPVFSVSTILPNFLYLGPEPTSLEHVEELLSLGVKRILNIAIECDDDQGLRLRATFERYTRIPMRDTVEEENVPKSVREACAALDDARLHSAPTFVHCKAGKSRSVTAVIAYLIHANHWTLGRAYAFVTERRKGISPNIGFVSELMSFEEQELGGKSVGVVNSSASVAGGVGNGGDADEAMPAYSAVGRRAAHLRESLPPMLQTQLSEMIVPGQLSAVGLGPSAVARVGDSAQEVEVKDASGRYRHMRRAPVDENTLQPMRRVSKAGLESSSYSAMLEA